MLRLRAVIKLDGSIEVGGTFVDNLQQFAVKLNRNTVRAR
jgi:hypothetical protein